MWTTSRQVIVVQVVSLSGVPNEAGRRTEAWMEREEGVEEEVVSGRQKPGCVRTKRRGRKRQRREVLSRKTTERQGGKTQGVMGRARGYCKPEPVEVGDGAIYINGRRSTGRSTLGTQSKQVPGRVWVGPDAASITTATRCLVCQLASIVALGLPSRTGGHPQPGMAWVPQGEGRAS